MRIYTVQLNVDKEQTHYYLNAAYATVYTKSYSLKLPALQLQSK